VEEIVRAGVVVLRHLITTTKVKAKGAQVAVLLMIMMKVRARAKDVEEAPAEVLLLWTLKNSVKLLAVVEDPVHAIKTGMSMGNSKEVLVLDDLGTIKTKRKATEIQAGAAQTPVPLMRMKTKIMVKIAILGGPLMKMKTRMELIHVGVQGVDLAEEVPKTNAKPPTVAEEEVKVAAKGAHRRMTTSPLEEDTLLREEALEVIKTMKTLKLQNPPLFFKKGVFCPKIYMILSLILMFLSFSIPNAHALPQSAKEKEAGDLWQKTQKVTGKLNQEELENPDQVITVTIHAPSLKSSSSPCELQALLAGLRTQCKW